MKFSASKTQRIRIAVIERDPLRLIGFRALLESESDFELMPAESAEVGVVAYGSHDMASGFC